MKQMGLKTRKLKEKAVNDNFLFEPSISLVAGTGFESPPLLGHEYHIGRVVTKADTEQ
jgi:hypothetical protein